jgi:TRAP-type C4-dicarboxylate transport system permease small subunit
MRAPDGGGGGGSSALDRLSERTIGALAAVASIALILTMLITVLNMVMRVTYRPFRGTFEIVGWLAATTNGLALGYTQLKRGHVDIDLLVRKFSQRVRASVQVVMASLSLLLFTTVAWRLFVYAERLREVGTVSDALRIAFYPFTYALALGVLGMALALAAEVVNGWREVLQDRNTGLRDEPGG